MNRKKYHPKKDYKEKQVNRTNNKITQNLISFIEDWIQIQRKLHQIWIQIQRKLHQICIQIQRKLHQIQTGVRSTNTTRIYTRINNLFITQIIQEVYKCLKTTTISINTCITLKGSHGPWHYISTSVCPGEPVEPSSSSTRHITWRFSPLKTSASSP